MAKIACFTAILILPGCAQGLVPDARNIEIPAPQKAGKRQSGVNESPDSVTYLPLGRDVLVPVAAGGDPLPNIDVGPFELRGETLGGALQLVLSDVDIPIAFQTDQGLSRTVTVTNLKGKLSDVVDQVCALADLYCAFEHGAIVVKDRQSFMVTIPPLGTTDTRGAMMTSMAGAIQAVTGRIPIVDASNRTIVYEATNRTADQVSRYLQKLRASTALVVYETYVWEVTLNSTSASGINWENIGHVGEWNFGVKVNSSINPDAGTPISIGLPTKGSVDFDTGQIFKFISSYGAVKTISQPQLTVLSGSTAKLRVADKRNYVSKITRTVSGDQVTVATDTDSVESGFTLQIESAWDNATVYGNINITLEDVRAIEVFDDNPESVVQLPQTTEREVQTQVRVRPGDSLLIAGLVRENDAADREGPGINHPIIPTSRSNAARNVELVFLLKPRVIVFTDTPSAHIRTPVDGDTPQGPVTLARDGDKTIPADQAALTDAPTATVPAADTEAAKAEGAAVDHLFTQDGTTVSRPESKTPTTNSATGAPVTLYPIDSSSSADDPSVEPVIRAPLAAPAVQASPLSPSVGDQAGTSATPVVSTGAAVSVPATGATTTAQGLPTTASAVAVPPIPQAKPAVPASAKTATAVKNDKPAVAPVPPLAATPLDPTAIATPVVSPSAAAASVPDTAVAIPDPAPEVIAPAVAPKSAADVADQVLRTPDSTSAAAATVPVTPSPEGAKNAP